MLMGLLQSLLSFLRKDKWTPRETYAILRDKRVSVSLNEPPTGSGPDFEMSLFCRILEIFRTCTISQNSPHSIYFKKSKMTPRL